MEFFSDKHIFPWLIGLAVAVLLSVTVAPWLLKRSLRRRGIAGVSGCRRVTACFLMGMAIPSALILVMGVFSPIVLLFGLALGGGLLASVGSKPRLPVWGAHLSILLLCNVLYVVGTHSILGRVRDKGKRVVDALDLHAIGKGLLMYRYDHGEYPDDLRRLVDAQKFSPRQLLPFKVEWSAEFPETRPYTGPCEYTYIRLPHGAPKDLVWVWQSPRFHDDEGAYVLYAGTQVGWVTPEQLQQELARTEAWLRDHPPSAEPASTPATATSQPK